MSRNSVHEAFKEAGGMHDPIESFGESISFKGETFEISDVKLDFKPVRDDILIYFGVMGEKGLKLATDIGDGIILNGYTSVSYAKKTNERAKDHPRGKILPVLGNVMVAMDDDGRQSHQRGKAPRLHIRYILSHHSEGRPDLKEPHQRAKKNGNRKMYRRRA